MNAEWSEHQLERIDDFRALSLEFFTTHADLVYDRLVDVKTAYDPDNVFHQPEHPPEAEYGVGGPDGPGDV